MHLFNSPVSLMTQTNWHEPCHLGTHCPSEAPRPLYLRAEKIKRDTWIPESDRIFASEKWYHPSTFLTSHDMKGHGSLFSIVQNDHNYLWRCVSYCHWCLPLGAMNKPILIALIHAFDIHETHLTESTFQVSSNDIQWQFGIWDFRCSPSNLQVHSELLLHSHSPKQAR